MTPEDEAKLLTVGNNWMLMTVPQATGKHGIDVPFFIGAVYPDPDQIGEVKDFKELLPPTWKGKFKPIKYTLGEDTSSNLSGDWFKERQITHLVLLESDQAEPGITPFCFCTNKVTHNSALLWYSDETGKYHMFHCRECAMFVLKWITGSQEEWEAYASNTKN